MRNDHEAVTKATPSELTPVVELADAVLHLARRLGSYRFADPGILPLSQLERLVLQHVSSNPGVSPTDLAHNLALRPSNASTAVRGLIKNGQLRREADAKDKRGVHLYITLAAAESIRLVHREWETLFAEAGIDSSALLDATRTLSTLEEALDALS